MFCSVHFEFWKGGDSKEDMGEIAKLALEVCCFFVSLLNKVLWSLADHDRRC